MHLLIPPWLAPEKPRYWTGRSLQTQGLVMLVGVCQSPVSHAGDAQFAHAGIRMLTKCVSPDNGGAYALSVLLLFD